jgi:L-lactate dehydrogenase (cytochrome)
MTPAELAELIKIRVPELDRVRRVLARSHSIDDLRREARRRLPRAVFDYVDGAADEELTVAANRRAFQRWQFLPGVLNPVGDCDTGTELFGVKLAAPLGLAPTGYTAMIHPGGERAVASAAAAAGLPYCLSTVGTTAIADLAAGGHPNLWYQLYALADRGLTNRMIDRAQRAGFKALEVTVDTAVAGRRVRDVRNGLTIPPRLSPGTIVDIGSHVGYWTAMVRGPALRFANVIEPDSGDDQGKVERTVANFADLFDADFDWHRLADVRSRWEGPLLIKGPIGPADARRAVDAGIDGIHLSNHGGRQLDRTIATIDLVRPVRQAVGPATVVIVDSGVRHGADIAIAVARGADLAVIARPYLYGLAVGGSAGVAHVIDLLVAQLRRALQLLGVNSLATLRQRGDELVVAADHRWPPSSSTR